MTFARIRDAVILFLLALFMGIYYMNEGLFHFDAVILAKAVETTCATGHLQPAVMGRYGSVLVNALFFLPFKMLGSDADLAIRISGVVFYALSIAAFFLLIRRLFGDRVQAVAGALLLAFTPFYLSSNTYGKEHGMSVFFFLVTLLMLYRGLGSANLFFIASSSLLLAFTITIRESMLAAVPLYLLAYFSPVAPLGERSLAFDRRRLSIPWLAAALLPLVISFGLAWRWYLGNEIASGLLVENTAFPYFQGLVSPIMKIAIKDLYISVPMIVFFFFPLGLAMIAFRKDAFLAAFLLIWALLIFFYANLDSYGPRYLDMVILPVYMGASYVVAGLFRGHKAVACVIIFAIIAQMFVLVHPILSFRRVYNGEKRFALYVNEETEKNALIITMDDGPFIERYGKRRTLSHPVGKKKNAEQMRYFMEEIKSYLRSGTPVYLTFSGLSYDPEEMFKRSIDDSFRVLLVGKKLSEDYHRPEIRFQKYEQMLFELKLKGPGPGSRNP